MSQIQNHNNPKSKMVLQHITRRANRSYRLECLTMVESQKCDNNKMNCDEEGCSNKTTPKETYYWNYDEILHNINCHYHKKQILAETANSQMFYSTENKCKPNDLFCNTHDSIIVWANETRDECTHTKIHSGSNYKINETQTHKVIYSEDDNMAFKLEKSENICNCRACQTTKQRQIST